MSRSLARGVLLCLLAVVAGGCDSTTTTPTTPSTPSVETFTGTLNPSAAVVHTFTATGSGTVSAQLTTVGPDATQLMGFSMGTFNTTTNVCQIVLDNSLAIQGSTLGGTASTAGTYCVRVYDNGTVTTVGTPFTYTVTVAHP